VHVFVERDTMKPGTKGMGADIRNGLAALAVESKSKL